jgi:hypothetical protein
LVDLKDATFEGQYDPTQYALAPINTNQLWTITYPDKSFHAFYGSLKTFEPGEMEEGKMVMCTGTIAPTNLNASGVETGPTYGSGPGTGSGTGSGSGSGSGS